MPEDLGGMAFTTFTPPPVAPRATTPGTPATRTGTGPPPLAPYIPLANYNTTSLANMN